ncbi:NAD(P)-dependent oxidoreductase [Haliangium sp.]|uniref:NAD(P)-dependent oxidoreductase n=1 Tax=Haliangium sp. TaxID=2663208 RepID=UPI003D105A0A
MNEISILGLGAMGSRMAQRLLAAGHAVTVYNRTLARIQPLLDRGATAAATPREAATGADLVIAMVTDDDASRALWCGPDGALAGLAPGAIAIESSTLTPAWVRTLDEQVRARDAHLLDAPVAGSRPQAEAGALIYLVGGPASALDRARPALAAMAGAIHHVGPVGAGATVKLAVNALFGVQVAALAELLGVLARADIEPARAVELLTAMPVTSPALAGVGALMAARSFAPQFPIDLVEKDLGYLEANAAQVAAEVPTTRAVREVYAQAQRAGHGGDNIAAVARLFE